MRPDILLITLHECESSLGEYNMSETTLSDVVAHLHVLLLYHVSCLFCFCFFFILGIKNLPELFQP